MEARTTHPRAIVTISVAVLICAACLGPFWATTPDFLSFYTGAKLVGTPYLYSPEHALEIQKQITGEEFFRPYIRPPFYAAMCWPLGKTPYRTAFVIWQCCNIAALIGFAALWRTGVLFLLITCWFPPLWWNFVVGQDIPLLLLFFAMALRLHERNRKWLAGFIFAFCAAKFHMFLLTPVAILTKRAWRFSAGLAAGGVLLFTLSAAVAGWNWPVENFEAARWVDGHEGSQGLMPAIGGESEVSLSSGLVATAVGLAVLGMTVLASSCGSFRCAMTVALCGSLTVSFHAFIYDWALLLPLLLCVAQESAPGKAIVLSALAGLAGLAVRFDSVAWFGHLFPLFLMVVASYLACRPAFGEFRKSARGPESKDGVHQ